MAGQPRVLAEVVVVAAAEGRPLDVERRAEDHVLAAGPRLLAEHAAEFVAAINELGRFQSDPLKQSQVAPLALVRQAAVAASRGTEIQIIARCDACKPRRRT